MYDTQTRGDSLRWYLSGATSDAGTQTDPNASLGNYRSSTELGGVAFTVASPIGGISIDYVSHANGPGTGTLTADSGGSLTWTPPGGSAGASVTIANGESKVVEGSAAAGSFVRVSRTSATALSGAATLTLADVYNNVIGLDNITSAEAAAGDTEYRAVFVKCVSSVSAANLKIWLATLGSQQTSNGGALGSSGGGTLTTTGTFGDWPASGFCRVSTSGGTLREIVYYSARTSTALTVPSAGRGLLGTTAAAGATTDKLDAVPGLAIGLETPGSQPSGSVQTIANEGAAPMGITWNTAIAAAGGLSVDPVTSGNKYAVWLKRLVVAGQTSTPSILNQLAFAFDAV